MNTEDKNYLLQIENLSVQFRTVEGTVLAVDKMNFQVSEGETLGIVGESGSGKSVSSLAVMGLIPNPPGEVVSGRIIFNGIDLLQLSEKELEKIRGNEISMIFQEPMTSLNPILSCGFQIAESLMLHRGMKKKEAMVKAVELLQVVGIADPLERAKQFPHQMSGGMRQRVMIALAIACRPKILIADEPTTALDVTIQAQILELMKKLNHDYKTVIIMITHDLGVVAETCDKVIVMYTGHVVEQAPTEEIFANPLHPYTLGLLNSLPKISQTRQRLEAIEGVVPNPTEKLSGCSFHPRCPKAMPICKEHSPQLFQVGDGHFVRCWLHSGGQDPRAKDVLPD